MSKDLLGDAWDDWFPGKEWKANAKLGCYRSHPGLQLGATGRMIWGGSCITPVIEDADVYIGFERSMRLTARAWPWTPGHEILFPIVDREAPASAADFARLVDWTVDQLALGRKVHAGCIGGHGRTGTFLAALVRVATGEVDAITYVRANYCRRAVESAKQIAFLAKHFGITKVACEKSTVVSQGSTGGSHSIGSRITGSHIGGARIGTGKGCGRVIQPLASGSIWGDDPR